MLYRPARLLATTFFMLTFSGCSWFNNVGEHFPVIGDRCEYWQCFTTYGQQQSDAIKQAKANAAQPQAQRPAENPPVAGATQPQAAPPSHVEYIDPSKLAPITAP